MSIDLEDLLALRPYAFHTTGETNLQAIRDERSLVSTHELLTGTMYAALLNDFRTSSNLVIVGGHRRLIRDQRPIRPGSLLIETGSTVEDYRNDINRRVFFRPGRATWIIRSGRKHFELYSRHEPLSILRIPLRSLIEQNPSRRLYVARCNSGSARHHGGQPVVRGPNTFRPLADAEFKVSEVVELSFVGRADLPPDAQYAESLTGDWKDL